MASQEIPQTRPIVTRAEAKKLGLKRYFTGLPCKNGHICERIVSNRICMTCNRSDERKRETRRNWDKKRDADPVAGAKELARKKAWKKSNPEWVKQYHSTWARKNPERLAQYARVWQARNRVKVNANARNRRALKRSAEGVHTADDINTILKLQKGMCAYCRAHLRNTFDVDHIIPLSLGGSNWPSNIQLLCEFCNSSKHNQDPIDYARKIGRLL